MSNLDLNAWTKEQLKAKAKDFKLAVGGNKPDLIERLLAHAPFLASMGVSPAAQAPQPAANVVPEGYAPATIPGMAPLPTPAAVPTTIPGMAPLPTPPVPTTKTTGAKREPKDQAVALMGAVRNAGLRLDVALSAVLTAYNATDLGPHFAALIGERAGMAPTPLQVEMTEATLKTLKVEDLKKMLKDQGQKVGGKKEELIQRLLHPETAKPAPQPLPSLTGLPLAPTGLPPAPAGLPAPGMPLPTPMGLPTDLPTVPGVQADLPAPPTGLPVGLPTNLPTVPGVQADLPPALPTGLPGAGSPRQYTLPNTVL